MANNRNLLKEAIADAKAVKETAIANAKAALEESFGPFLREKLSQKISEMEETDENMEYENQGMKDEMMDEVSLDELLAELEEGEVEEELYEAKKEEKEEKEEEDENVSIEDMSENDLKSFIESVIKDMVANKELEAGHEGMENEEGAEDLDERHSYSKKISTKNKNHLTNTKGKDEYRTDKTEEDDAPYSKRSAAKITNYKSLEEIDLNELLNELELEEETLNEMASRYKLKPEYENNEKVKEFMLKAAERATSAPMKQILKSLGKTGDANMYIWSKEGNEELGIPAGKDGATWNMPAIRQAFEKEGKNGKQFPNGPGLFSKYVDAIERGQGRAPGTPGAKKNPNAKFSDLEEPDLGGDNLQLPPGMDTEDADYEEIDEAYATIRTLKKELNEINVLNAKLLYTNKIFRNKSLTESQKIKVLTAFDRATSKKEVELIYETLQGLKTSNVTKSPIRESLSSASKALGSASARPIIENDAFARMRELAFGKK
jgi:hypothetical protein